MILVLGVRSDLVIESQILKQRLLESLSNETSHTCVRCKPEGSRTVVMLINAKLNVPEALAARPPIETFKLHYNAGFSLLSSPTQS